MKLFDLICPTFYSRDARDVILNGDVKCIAARI